MDAIGELVGRISQAPDPLRGWIYWLVFINSTSILFIFTRVEARWALAAWLVSIPAMGLASERLGFTAALALVHLSIWAPLLVWLVWRNPVSGMRDPWGFYLVLLFASNLIALGLDTADLYRYATGGGALA